MSIAPLHRWPMIGPAILTSFLSVAVARADLNDGLVAYWSFDEGSGTVAHDSSGYGNHGTIYGADWVTGVSGDALLFNGLTESDYVEVAGHWSLELAGDFSLTVWLRIQSYPTGGHDRGALIKSTGSANYQCNYSLGVWNVDKTVLFIIGDGTGSAGYQLVTSTTALEPDQWYHVAAVRCNELQVYVNGFLENSVSREISQAVNDHPLYVGAWPFLSTTRFAGTLDEARIYSRALSQDEIQQLMWEANPETTEQYLSGDQSHVSGSDVDPVSTATGNFFHRETDLSGASRAGLMAFSRYYNSAGAAPARLRRGEGVEGTMGQGFNGNAQLAKNRERVAESSAGPQPARGGGWPTNRDEGSLQRGMLAFTVGGIALPFAGLACWLVQRRLRSQSRAWRGQADAPLVHQGAKAGRQSRAIRKRGGTRSGLTCLQEGGWQ